MKRKIAICTLVLSGLVAGSHADLTLVNADFEDLPNTSGNNPNDWTTVESHNGAFYAEDVGATGSGSVSLNMQSRPLSTVEQSFLTAEATADTYGTIDVTMDMGTRANTGIARTLKVEIWNVSDASSLASETYTWPTTGTGFIENKTFSLSYDNTAAGLVGDTIALRLTSDGAGATFATTHWVDNIVAIPEPSTIGMVALFGGGILFIRRKLMV